MKATVVNLGVAPKLQLLFRDLDNYDWFVSQSGYLCCKVGDFGDRNRNCVLFYSDGRVELLDKPLDEPVYKEAEVKITYTCKNA